MSFKRKMCVLLVFVMLAGILAGCPARRPEEPAQDPERIIVPEVSKIFFDEVPLEDGPRMAQQLVKHNQEGDMTVWFEEEDQFWVLVKANGSEQLEVVEVLQRVPDENRTLLEVRLVRGEADQVVEGEEEENGASLIRLDLNNMPNGVAFLIDAQLEETLEAEVEKNTGQQGQARTQQPQQPQQPEEQQAPEREVAEQTAELTSLNQGAEINSPVQVQGRARVEGDELKIRLRDDKGESLAENNTTMAAAYPQISDFNTTLTYTSTGEEREGKIEILSLKDEEVLAAVPVVIK